jgi:hypothetical protein
MPQLAHVECTKAQTGTQVNNRQSVHFLWITLNPPIENGSQHKSQSLDYIENGSQLPNGKALSLRTLDNIENGSQSPNDNPLSTSSTYSN